MIDRLHLLVLAVEKGVKFNIQGYPDNPIRYDKDIKEFVGADNKLVKSSILLNEYRKIEVERI